MISTLIPEPSATPIAEIHRQIAIAAASRTDHGVFAAAAYDPRSVAEARVRLKKRMLDEHQSTTVFSALVANVLEAGAPIDTGTVILKMAQDELRHAEICGRAVVAMGGTNAAQRDTTVRPLAQHVGCCPIERALRNVLVTSISEMYSVAFFVASLDRMTDPYLRSVTRELLSDEVLHARFGFYYLQIYRDWLASRPEVRRSIARYLRYVFAVCEGEFVRGHRPRAGADDERLGLVSSELGLEVFVETMQHGVVPGLERFGLDATDAWRRRALA